MRVMVMVKATKNSEAGILPGDPRAPASYEKLFEEMGKFNEELVKAGVMLAGDGLHPSSKGTRVRFSGGRKTVIDGPFAETKELVAGYWIWQVKSMEEAIEWVQRCPDPMPGEESEIELRPVYGADDFGKEFTPELRAQEERLRAEARAPAAVVGDPATMRSSRPCGRRASAGLADPSVKTSRRPRAPARVARSGPGRAGLESQPSASAPSHRHR